LANERTALRTYVRGIALMAQDPAPEEAAEFAVVRAEFTARVRALEAELAAASVPVVNVARLRALHERLARTHIADLMDGLVSLSVSETTMAHGATEELRTLLVSLVASATVVERRPQSHPVWAGPRSVGCPTCSNCWTPACSSWRSQSRRRCCRRARSCTGPACAATGNSSGRSGWPHRLVQQRKGAPP
jgi:hypothetical protein